VARTRWFAAAFVALVVLFADPGARSQPTDAALNLPDGPLASPLQTSSSSPATTPAGQTGAQTTPGQNAPMTEEERRKLSEEQLKKQEKQRVFAVMATFNTTSNHDAVPLSTGQKYQLFFKSATDPWPFVLTAFGAGIDQADNSFPEYGQGVQGYAKRYGAAYADYFTGNLLGNAVLAGILKEDPRYFQKGTGSFGSRFLWAAGSTVWCKRDNGSWGPNYANVMGNLMGSSISNFYYPASDRTVGGTLGRGFTVTAQAIIGSEIIEFWPDMVRHHNRKQAEKLAKQAARDGTQKSTQPAPPASPAPPAPQPGVHRTRGPRDHIRPAGPHPLARLRTQIFAQADLHCRQPVIAAAERETSRWVSRIGRRKTRQKVVRSHSIGVTPRTNVRRQLHRRKCLVDRCEIIIRR